MMNALGGNGVAMGYDQVFSALQTGVIDGAENNMPSYVFSNHYTAAKYYALTEHLIIPEVMMFSKRTWATLSAEDQNLVKKFAREAQLEERDLWNNTNSRRWKRPRRPAARSSKSPTRRRSRMPSAGVGKYGPKYADMIKRIQAV